MTPPRECVVCRRQIIVSLATNLLASLWLGYHPLTAEGYSRLAPYRCQSVHGLRGGRAVLGGADNLCVSPPPTPGRLQNDHASGASPSAQGTRARTAGGAVCRGRKSCRPWAVRSDEMTQLRHRQVCAIQGDQSRYVQAAAPLAPVTGGIDGGSDTARGRRASHNLLPWREDGPADGSFLCGINDVGGCQAARLTTSAQQFQQPAARSPDTEGTNLPLQRPLCSPGALRSGPGPLACASVLRARATP